MPKLEDLLRINDSVYLEILTGPLSHKSFVTRVEDMDNKAITLSAPIDPERNIHIRLVKGTKVRISFAKKDAVYQFNSTVISSVAGRLPTVIISKPDELLRFQRREFVRLDDIITVSYKVAIPDSIDVKYKLVDKDDIDLDIEQNDVQELEGFTKNISGNGMLLIVKKDIAKIGNLLEVSFRLPGHTKIYNVIGEIVRIANEVKVEYPDEIGVGIKFVKINERDRTDIVRYIFDRQREMIKKGLLEVRKRG